VRPSKQHSTKRDQRAIRTKPKPKEENGRITHQTNPPPRNPQEGAGQARRTQTPHLSTCPPASFFPSFFRFAPRLACIEAVRLRVACFCNLASKLRFSILTTSPLFNAAFSLELRRTTLSLSDDLALCFLGSVIAALKLASSAHATANDAPTRPLTATSFPLPSPADAMRCMPTSR
jgi:hypothetical protein